MVCQRCGGEYLDEAVCPRCNTPTADAWKPTYQIGRTQIVAVTVTGPGRSTTRVAQLIFQGDHGWSYNDAAVLRALGIPYDPATDEVDVMLLSDINWDIVII